MASDDLVVNIAQVDAINSAPKTAVWSISDLQSLNTAFWDGDGYFQLVIVLRVASVVVLEKLIVRDPRWHSGQVSSFPITRAGLGWTDEHLFFDVLGDLGAGVMVEVPITAIFGSTAS